MKTRAAVLGAMGEPQPYASSRPLEWQEVELADPGPGEVLVQVRAAGLCHSDLSVINGSRPRVTPMVLGHEASGYVLEVGRDVVGFEPGDAVVFSFLPVCRRCENCVSGRAWLCTNGARANVAGELLTGGLRFHDEAGRVLYHHLGVSAFSYHTVVAQESLVKIDPDLPAEVAALFGCAVMTGVGAVVNEAKVRPGDSVAIFGLGGVGLSAVMGARVAGAQQIIAVDRVDAKLQIARELGAEHLVDASTTDPVEAIRDLSGGGVQFAVETVGNAAVLAQAYASTRRGGVTVTVGLPDPSRQLSLSAQSLVTEVKTLRGCYMGSAVPHRDVPRFIRLYQAGLLPVDRLLTRTIRPDDVNGAFDDLAHGKGVRQAIRFDGWAD